jgi:phosphoribosylanthranilate isomerase
MTEVKICGVSAPDILAAVRSAGAEHVGFVGVPRSPRYIAPTECRALAEGAIGLNRVGLFADPGDDDIALYAEALDAIQLHGGETPERTAEIRARFGKPVWKAIGVSSRRDLDAAARYEAAADLVLLDAKPAPGEMEGGRGVRFDWELLKGWRSPLPWGLAGGLAPENVAAAVAATGAPLVDVSSGVEEAPGQKSREKILAFASAAKAA